MKFLDGSQVAEYMQPRQLKAVRSLKQVHHINPRLSIVNSNSSMPTTTYLRLKQQYGTRIEVDVDLHQVSEDELKVKIKELNDDDLVQGIVLQLPLNKRHLEDELCNLINPIKDVDGLNEKSNYDSATATAIYWLLVSYGVDLLHKQIMIVGRGKLVGRPLVSLFNKLNLDFQIMDETNSDLNLLKTKDIIISAVGQPNLIQSQYLKSQAIVVDAGVSIVNNKLQGDVDLAVYQSRDDLTITPVQGGVGPLTIAILFDNLIRACSNKF